MQLVDLEPTGDFSALTAGEHEPWGGVAEALHWREKTQHVGLREDDGRLVAAAGLVLAEVRVGARPALPVAGIGGVLVTRSERGRGLSRLVIERVLALARECPVERAMLFCLERNMGLYAKFGFLDVGEPVRAQQPQGPIEMPLPAMWKPLVDAASWPPGPVELAGEPF
jgi:predicted GNAT family N-acyltransferase